MGKKKESSFDIKKAQIGDAIKLGALKKKLAKKKAEAKEEIEQEISETEETPTKEVEAAPRRARSQSVFAPDKVIPKKRETQIKKEVKAKEVDTQVIEGAIKSPPPQKEEKKEIAPAEVERLGPTGRHVKDLLPPVEKKVKSQEVPKKKKEELTPESLQQDDEGRGKGEGASKEYRDFKPARKQQMPRYFDVRDRQGLRDHEGEQRWRKRRPGKRLKKEDAAASRPSQLSVRLPISIKDLAGAMKVKSSELIAKLFLQGVAVTINDLLSDPTTVQLLGEELGCTITIDTSEEEKIRITDHSIREEINLTDSELLTPRPPVVAFMGHVDHGKTSLIDYICKSNILSGESGAITQHIGAFRYQAKAGDITILDTPGHEAFSAMRARGADVTDIVVLVIAGDEGIRAQTQEAIQHARAAGVTILVALNKCDKPNFDADMVYRQLADCELLPEAWGGQTLVVNCSATTGKGVPELLEMIALQSEILELQANPQARARGTVLESEMHKGFGTTATVLVQNGTLRLGDAVVLGHQWGRVKTMQNEYSRSLNEAVPSTPVVITGLSGLPIAGDEFIVVSNEKEAKEIASARAQDLRQTTLQQSRPLSIEKLMKKAEEEKKKVLSIILRADVQGSLEALKAALQKIHSDKVMVEIVFSGIGEVSESDVQLAAASGSMILGFHTQVESHAEQLLKEYGVTVCLHDVIYHAIDRVKELMAGCLDKIAKEIDKGTALVQATFKSSQLGMIAGCRVTEGTVHRNDRIRQIRSGETIWTGGIASLKRVKEDVKEVQKGVECGIVLSGNSDIKEGDVLESYEVTYISQEL